MVFLVALEAVAILLLAAIPGYIFTKRKMISEECIPGLSKILVYVCQPCLAVYTFGSAEYSIEKLIDVGVFALLAVLIHGVMIGGAYLALRKRYEKAVYRVMTFAVGSANCAFFGIPIIEALMPEAASEVILFTMVYSLVMNIIGWTAGSAVMARDPRYISVKKLFVNPAVIGTAIAVLLFVTELPLPTDLTSIITTTARMATPLSMIVMGMRLGAMRVGSLFKNTRIYATVAAKQLVMPALAFLIALVAPVSYDIKSVFFIISACPVAAVVLSYAEIVGEGQEDAASMLLLGTMLSILTLPVMMLLLPLLS